MFIMIDIEADGPIPGDYSMISFGAVLCRDISKRFYGKLKPISDNYIQEALNVSSLTREETFKFDDPQIIMENFNNWLVENNDKNERLFFISDNNGFDWQFINWYFWHFLGHNPFGHSSMNLGSLYKGLVKDIFKNFKHLRDTAHTHNPIDDAVGNVEALIKMKNEYDLKIKL